MKREKKKPKYQIRILIKILKRKKKKLENLLDLVLDKKVYILQKMTKNRTITMNVALQN